MSLISGLRTWWQRKTGEEETPFDGYAPVWVISMLVHLVLMFILSFCYIKGPPMPVAEIVQALAVEEEPELFELPEQVAPSDLPSEVVGPNSFNEADAANSVAPTIAEVSLVPTPELTPTQDFSNITIDVTALKPTALHQSDSLVVRGSVGEGTTGATGAVDRITQEILNSLEQRKTLVVWLFDKSPSMLRQRSEVLARFDRIYKELGVIEAAGNPAFAKHEDKPLLTSIVAFGETVDLLTKKPTDNVAEIKEIVAGIPQDTSGTEKVFSAVYQAVTAYKHYRIPDAGTREPERNVMLVVFTDERGDDYAGLDMTVDICRRYAVPAYVVGVPAPFGREETLVKWVDPDPMYDQTPQWGKVNQGPETLAPERLKLSFGGSKEETTPIDSGFGPFALTRLCYETGGIYFAVHPNRNVNRAVSKRETAEFSAHLEHFFDPTVMKRYKPDYVTMDEYKRRIMSNKARYALSMAAQMSWVQPMEDPKLKFVKTDEAKFNGDLTEAQKGAAKLEPLLVSMYETLKQGEADRKKEATPRWQAGFDLAMGRLMAVMVRTQSYNMMLAAAKRGMRFTDEKNNTWVLEPADKIEVGSQMENMAKKAQEYLNRVVNDHPDTPWAYLARQELDTPLGWTWKEEYTAPPAPRGGGGGNNPRPAKDDKAMKLKRTPKRAVPKL